MAIGTGPSQGFMSRMGGQMPGMLNSFAQSFGGDMSGAAKGSAALLGAPRRKKVLPGGTAPTMGGGQSPNMIPQGGMGGGQPNMVRMPDYFNRTFGRGRNTGITGGMSPGFQSGVPSGMNPISKTHVMPQTGGGYMAPLPPPDGGLQYNRGGGGFQMSPGITADGGSGFNMAPGLQSGMDPGFASAPGFQGGGLWDQYSKLSGMRMRPQY